MSRIVILKDYLGFLAHGLHSYNCIDLNKVKKVFEDNGFEVVEYDFKQVANGEADIKDSYVVYNSSSSPEYKAYIDDALYAISADNILIPRYDVLRAHENKGFQEILKKKLGIPSIPALYLATERDFERCCNSLKYPVVLKTVSGAGSAGVFKIDGPSEGRSLIKRLFRPKNYRMFLLKKYVKKYIVKSRYIEDFYKLSFFTGRYVIQEFIPGLSDDWKVLVFYDKFYVLNRKVRRNDFRASGSGRLSYLEPPTEVLDFAREVYEKFDTPMASLDICVHSGRCSLIEMQGVDFGPYTIINSPFYYIYNGRNWEKVEGRSDYAEEYAASIVKYIKSRYIEKE